jgi:hypothetical protein
MVTFQISNVTNGADIFLKKNSNGNVSNFKRY